MCRDPVDHLRCFAANSPTIRALETTCLRELRAAAGDLRAETVLSRIFNKPIPVRARGDSRVLRPGAG